MPVIGVSVPESRESVFRPVVSQVLEQITTSLDMPNDIPVLFPGDGLSVAVHNSTMDKDTDTVKFINRNRYLVAAEWEFAEVRALSYRFFRPDETVFFHDPGLDVYLKPAYQRVEFRIGVTFRATDHSQAMVWITNAKRRASRGQLGQLHTVKYHFQIPMPMLTLLCTIYDMRERVKPLNESMGDWWKRCFDKSFSVIANQKGANETCVIEQVQTRVEGWFDFTHSVPKFDRSSEAGSWDVTFNYVFGLDLADAVVMNYPLMIHNQIIPKDFRDDRKPFELTDIVTYGSMTTEVMDKLSHYNRYNYSFSAYPGVPIPSFDDWLPAYTADYNQNLFRMLLQVDPNDRKALVCLNRLGQWEIHPLALEYMTAYREDLTRPRENIFLLGLHRRYWLMDTAGIRVDSGLNIYYNTNLDEREYYHMTVDMLYNPALLSLEALLKLCKYGDFAIYYLTILDPSLTDSGFLPALRWDALLGRNVISLTDLQGALRYMESSLKFNPSLLTNNALWHLVGSFVVAAHRGVPHAAG